MPVIVFSESPEIADFAAVELSKNSEIAVIERREARALLAESAKAPNSTLEDGVRMGRILGAERVVSLRQVGSGLWQIEVVDAASGRLLASWSDGVEKEELAAKCAELLKAPLPVVAETSARVALPDFAFEIENASFEDRAASLKIAEQLRRQLQAGGHDILDRAAAAQVANEQMLSDKGWLAGGELPKPLLGADVLVAGRWMKDRFLDVAILSPASGSLVVRQAFPTGPEGTAFDLDPVLAWIHKNLPESTAGTVHDRELIPRQFESLEPFYRGIALYQSGKVLEATLEFQRAYTLNDKFEEAYLWEARCYDRAGLPAMSGALRSFVEKSLVGRGVSSMSLLVPVDGLTFIGIAANHPSTRQRLEVLITEAASKGRQRVLLPENLARLRDEYDLLLGLENSRGHSWQQSPGFLMQETLSGSLTEGDAGWKLRLDVNETVSGKTLASRSVSLSNTAAEWPREVEAAVRQLLQDWEKGGATSDATLPPLPTEQDIRAALGKKGNLAILQLALKAPDALATEWHALEKPWWDLPNALNLGLREYLLEKIPAQHPKRPWMELERIAAFLPLDPWAREFIVTPIDPLRELEAFVRRHPDDAPGLVAEYMLLWETMATLPPAGVEQRFANLDRKIRELGGQPDVKNWDRLHAMPDQLRLLAAAAQGKPGDLPVVTDWEKFPHRMLPKVGERSQIILENKSPWAVNEWRFLNPDSPTTRMHEAKAALALLGRGNNRFVVDPAWMKEFPNSVALTSFVIRSMRLASKYDGLPLRAPFDAERERALYRQMVEYVFDQLKREIAFADDRRELDWLENTQLREFFTELAQPGFQRTVPDEEVETMRQTLIAEVAAASDRIGNPSRSIGRGELLSWRDINRAANSFADGKMRQVDQEKAYDQEFLRSQAAVLLADLKGKPALESTWYQRLGSMAYRTLPLPVLAGYYRDGLPAVRRDYLKEDLGSDDMERLLQYAVTLLGGGFHEEAEEVFLAVFQTSENDLNRGKKSAELRANAALNLGALAIHSGRESEGAALLRKAIEISGSGSARLIQDAGWNTLRTDTVQSLALRLLSDLREQIPENQVVHSVGQIRVPAPGYFPGKVSYFYRVPARFDPASGRKYRVLLVVPSVNQDTAEYCKAGHAWARFADEHDLFLVVPEFMRFWSSPTLPQVWSGQATLQALSELQRRYPVTTDGLLLHGYGLGASFLQRFAIWRPQLCAAASLHSSYDWAWEEALPEGLGDLSALRDIPLFVTCGERDGEIDHTLAGSYSPTVRFVTFARGAGVSVDWQSLPGVVHRPSPDMESLSQKFLEAHLLPDRKAAAAP